MHVKQELSMLWNWHGKKINVALMVTKSGEADNSSNAKIHAFALPTEEIRFWRP